jgi:hypothetical protein
VQSTLVRGPVADEMRDYETAKMGIEASASVCMR